MPKTVIEPPENNADHSNGRADMETGFPSKTMMSVLNKGIPPWGQDHNGIFYKNTDAVRWMQAGNISLFDRDLAGYIGGYAVKALIKSTRYSYVFYIHMADGNYANPYEGNTKDDYWINSSKPGNNCVISTILSDDTDNISYLNGDFRILTKVAGAKSALYVSTNNGNDDNTGFPDAPLQTLQKAIDQVPDGGTATIYLYYKDVFNMTRDNSPYVGATLGETKHIDIGSRRLRFVPYGQDDFYNVVNALLHAQDGPQNIYTFADLTRRVINISTGRGSVNGEKICAALKGTLGGTLTFLGIDFTVAAPPQMGNGQLAPLFVTLDSIMFSGCNFSGLDNLDFLFNGWGGDTGRLTFNTYNFKDEGKLIVLLDTGILTVAANSVGHSDTGIGNYQYMANNCVEFLKSPAHYENVYFIANSYDYDRGDSANYFPRGLKTTFEMNFNN